MNGDVMTRPSRARCSIYAALIEADARRRRCCLRPPDGAVGQESKGGVTIPRWVSLFAGGQEYHVILN